MTARCSRQLKQQANDKTPACHVAITYSEQPANNLVDTPSSYIDITIFLQASQCTAENGLGWKRSIGEAGQILKWSQRIGKWWLVAFNMVACAKYTTMSVGMVDLVSVYISYVES